MEGAERGEAKRILTGDDKSIALPTFTDDHLRGVVLQLTSDSPDICSQRFGVFILFAPYLLQYLSTAHSASAVSHEYIEQPAFSWCQLHHFVSEVHFVGGEIQNQFAASNGGVIFRYLG